VVYGGWQPRVELARIIGESHATSVFCARSRATGDTRDARAGFFRDFRVRVGVRGVGGAERGLWDYRGGRSLENAPISHGASWSEAKKRSAPRPVNRIASRRAVKSAEQHGPSICAALSLSLFLSRDERVGVYVIVRRIIVRTDPAAESVAERTRPQDSKNDRTDGSLDLPSTSPLNSRDLSLVFILFTCFAYYVSACYNTLY